MRAMKNKIFRATILLASMTLVVSSGAWALGSGPTAAASSVVTAYFHHDRVGYLGVDFEDLTAEQRSTFHLQGKQGVAIAAVDHDAPAGQAGLRAQDVVIEMNGQPAQNAAELRSMLKKATVGQTVELTILRKVRPSARVCSWPTGKLSKSGHGRSTTPCRTHPRRPSLARCRNRHCRHSRQPPRR